MSSWLERADHTADDFEDPDFAVAAEGTANERAATRDGAARSTHRLRIGPVGTAPVIPPLPRRDAS